MERRNQKSVRTPPECCLIGTPEECVPTPTTQTHPGASKLPKTVLKCGDHDDAAQATIPFTYFDSSRDLRRRAGAIGPALTRRHEHDDNGNYGNGADWSES